MFRGVLLFGQVVAIASSLAYVLLELAADDSRKHVYLAIETLAGVSGGAVGIWRVHMAMASTEKDRSRAISLSQLAILTGLTLGPSELICHAGFRYPTFALQ